MNYREFASAFCWRNRRFGNHPRIFCMSLPKGGTTPFHRYLEVAGTRLAGAGPMRLIHPDRKPRADLLAEVRLHLL